MKNRSPMQRPPCAPKRPAPAGFRVARTLLVAAALATAAPLLAQQQDTIATMDDPRAHLAAGAGNSAGFAGWNMRMVSFSPKPAEFDHARGLAFINSDLAFRGTTLYQGNFSGFSVWDVSDPSDPDLLSAVECATDQGDPSIYGDLLFISAESPRARIDCGMQGVENGADRMRGVRIFDVSNPRSPRLVKNVQTCRGSHTHTLLPHPTDDNVLYIYVGGSSSVRDAAEVAGCSSGTVAENPNTSQYRVDIIRVPLDDVEQAAVVGYARIFENLPQSPGRAGVAAGDAPQTGRRAGGPSGCHDLTSYPAYDLVAGSCGSFGILLDVSNPEQPVRLDAKSDLNFSLWHTAVFNNDASSVVFTDEWGGGTSPRCRITDPVRLGGNTLLSINDDGTMTQHGYFKMLAAQTDQENCVSHNGGLVPVPGRDLMVQGWYQGGINVFDFTDPTNPVEIAWFDRGPVDAETLVPGGSWGAYWYNGHIYSSELARGLDILELTPSEHLSQNEIDAAKLVVMEEYNPQAQPRLEWPAAFPVARSYLDQLVRNGGLAEARTTAISEALAAAERVQGPARRDRLNRLATAIDADVRGAADSERVSALAASVRDLAGATR
ncbi:MAG: hypothetical protein WDZ89_03905 [Gemmatimonadota bacterium]